MSSEVTEGEEYRLAQLRLGLPVDSCPLFVRINLANRNRASNRDRVGVSEVSFKDKSGEQIVPFKKQVR